MILVNYTIPELASIAWDERHAVRDELLRRCEVEVKKLRRARERVAEIEAGLDKIHKLFKEVA